MLQLSIVFCRNRNLLGLTIMELQNEGYQKAENQAAAQTILTMHRIKRDFPTIDDDTLRDILRRCVMYQVKCHLNVSILGMR